MSDVFNQWPRLMASTYQRTDQLRLKHLRAGELFRFCHDVRTAPWTKRDGTPGETTLVYSAGSVYKRLSARRIVEVEAWHGKDGKTCQKIVGKASTLGAGLTQAAVSDRWWD